MERYETSDWVIGMWTAIILFFGLGSCYSLLAESPLPAKYHGLVLFLGFLVVVLAALLWLFHNLRETGDAAWRREIALRQWAELMEGALRDNNLTVPERPLQMPTRRERRWLATQAARGPTPPA